MTRRRFIYGIVTNSLGWLQSKLRFSSTESATAGDRLGGVRPSSGAAMSERERAPMESDASEQPVLAAPEDGRTPMTLQSTVTDPLQLHESRRTNPQGVAGDG